MTIFDKNQDNENKYQTNDSERAKVGRGVIFFALFIIAILGGAALMVAIFSPNDGATASITFKERSSLVKDILTALLPVLGTWVGTVLAFYFSKENFAVAAQQTSDLVRQLTPDQKLQAIPAVAIMLSMNDQAVTKTTINDADNKINLITILLEALNKSGKNRLPLIDSSGKIKYIIHRSIIDKFISEQALSGGGGDLSKLTLEDLFKSDHYKRISTAFGTVNRDVKLDAVKTLIDSNPDCSDVFVTEDGTRNSPALGWITNVMLAEQSKV